MDLQNTFSVSFHQRIDKIDKNGTAPIFMRVTVNGERAEISLNRRFSVDRWHNGKPKGSKPDAVELSEYMLSVRDKVYRIQRKLVELNEQITAEKIKNFYTGNFDDNKSLIQIFEYHNKQVFELIGKDYSKGTYDRYETSLKHLKDFMHLQYKISDIKINQLKFEFISNFEYYLKTVRKCDHNTTLKYIKNFRKIINICIKNGWLKADPFIQYSAKLHKVERGYLTQEELEAIEQKTFSIKRIDQVRDIFIFSCYTGLAYAEVAKLTNDHIVKGIDGEKWINIRRTKTDSKSLIPILPQAEEILAKYRSLVHENNKGLLLPVITNQRMNTYLKEVADVCDITKNLTFHMARHTFATTVTLTNGVSIESVSAMLGHQDIKTTQIYAKVVEKKISNDMAELKKKIGFKEAI